MCNIRLLKPDEIDVRAQQVTKEGAILLLYKNSRTDMAILDETFGMFGWQREHSFKDGKNYCKVSIWDEGKKQWVSKEDIGTESNTEAEKGEASDAFKRACFNIGIGRELYTAPFIWVPLNSDELYSNSKTQKWQLKANVHFQVGEIEYDADRNISSLRIIDQNANIRFEYPRNRRIYAPAVATDPVSEAPIATPQPKRPLLMEYLANDEQCRQVMQWVYNAHSLASDPLKFDACKWIAERREVGPQELAIFREKYAAYYLQKTKK